MSDIRILLESPTEDSHLSYPFTPPGSFMSTSWKEQLTNGEYVVSDVEMGFSVCRLDIQISPSTPNTIRPLILMSVGGTVLLPFRTGLSSFHTPPISASCLPRQTWPRRGEVEFVWIKRRSGRLVMLHRSLAFTIGVQPLSIFVSHHSSPILW